MVGLDTAGKTTILYQFKLGQVVNLVPTMGFNIEQIKYNNIIFTVWNVGGQSNIRRLWKHYYTNVQGVIFVIDSSDRCRINDLYDEFYKMINDDELKDASILIYANKQDIQGAMTTLDIINKLDLQYITDRQWYIQSTCAIKNTGLHEGLDWLNVDNLPDSINWVEKGAVTPVKNQGQCGSCWTFSVTGAVEGLYYNTNNVLESFSEQQLVDCAGGKWGNMGCNGGEMDNAFKYIEANPLQRETDYPYVGKVNDCQYNQQDSIGKVTSFVDVKPNDPQQLKAALVNGPVSIAIEADQTVFQFYKSGVLTEDCGQQLDHGVLVVGYGTENGEEYFLVKNSWGPQWGDNGYIKISTSNNNVCGILSQPSYPIYNDNIQLIIE